MKYQVHMSATIKTYRVVTVEAKDAIDAASRAKRLVRKAEVDGVIAVDSDLMDGEDLGDWCDSDDPSRPRVYRVEEEVTP